MSYTKGSVASLGIIVLTLVWSNLGRVEAESLTWQPTGGPYGGTVPSLAIHPNGDVFAAPQGGGVFRSTDQGETWVAAGLANTTVNTLTFNANGHLFAGASSSVVWRSTDHGESWTSLPDFTFFSITALTFNADGHLFAGTFGVFRSTDSGDTWQPTDLNNVIVSAQALHADGHLLVGTEDGKIFRLDNTGAIQAESSLPQNTEVLTFAIDEAGQLFAGTGSGGVFRSADNGQTWEAFNAGLTSIRANALAFDANSDLFAGTNTGVFRFAKGGDQWASIYTAPPDAIVIGSVVALAVQSNNSILAGTNEGVIRSTDGGENWASVNTGLAAAQVTALAGDLDGHLFAGSAGGGIYRSVNKGATWTQQGLRNMHIQAVTVLSDGTVFVGSQVGVFRSTDNGETWEPFNTGLTTTFVRSLEILSNGEILAGTINGIFRSQVSEDNWTPAGTDLPPSVLVDAFVTHSSGVIFAGTDKGVFQSTDNAATWQSFNTGLTSTPVQALAFTKTEQILAGTWSGGIFRSPIAADNWSPASTGLTETQGSGKSIFALVVTEAEEIFAGHLGGGVFRSTDNGETWVPENAGLTQTDVRSLALAADGHLLAGTYGGGAFRSAEAVQEEKLPEPTEPSDVPPPMGKIVFTSDRDNGNFEIYVMEADGGNPVNLTQHVATDFEPSWSPNGEKIAFVSKRDGGPGVLWSDIFIMEADGGNPVNLTQLPEAEDRNPAWSPDGGKITFNSFRDPGAGEIYVMDPDGSNPIRLTNTIQAEGDPAWSPDGNQIVFWSAQDGNSEIYVMDPDGGNPIRLTENQAADFKPAWSPDGQKIAFVSDRDGNNEIYVMDSDGSNPIRLTQNQAADSNPGWSPDGQWIVFSSNRDGDEEIYIMPKDGNAPPVNLTDFSGGNDKDPDWTPPGLADLAFEGALLIEEMGAMGNPPFQPGQILTFSGSFANQGASAAEDFNVVATVTAPDGMPIFGPEVILSNQALTPGETMPFQGSFTLPDLAQSPNLLAYCSRIVFESYRDGNAEIYAINPDGTGLTNLTQHPSDDQAPRGSPNGHRIAFETNRDGSFDIYVMNPDGTGLLNVSNLPMGAFFSDAQQPWSPDGDKISFHSQGDIYAVNIDGTGLANLTNHPAGDGNQTWSPDGKHLAFITSRDIVANSFGEEDGNPELYTMDASGNQQQPLIVSLGTGETTPTWSPDGTRIAFVSQLVGVDSDVFVVNADGTGLTNLTNNPAIDINPVWSPDGKQLIFVTNRDGNTEIYRMNMDGTGLTNLTENPGRDESPRWSLDGSQIVFWSDRDGNSEIYVMDANGADQTRLTDHASADLFPAWSSGAFRLTVTLDAENVVPETQEDNNDASTVFTIVCPDQGAEPPPVEGAIPGAGSAGPLALDLDLNPGDQGQRQTANSPKAGDTVVIDLTAGGIKGFSGFEVVLVFDAAQLAFKEFSASDVFLGAVPILTESEGKLTISAALLGTTATEDAGSMGQVTFQVLGGFTGGTSVQLTSAQFGGPAGEQMLEIGPDATVVIGGATLSPDFDGDGTVGFSDFITFAQGFGTSQGDDGYNVQLDLNSDGEIGFSDFIIFAQGFGQPVE
ncbi:MAG: DUF5050 domain-containing protein [bacterium]|nr:DUF5050 domain-containing protein [bacterium]